MLKFYKNYHFLITFIAIISVALLSAGIVSADALRLPSEKYPTIQSVSMMPSMATASYTEADQMKG